VYKAQAHRTFLVLLLDNRLFEKFQNRLQGPIVLPMLVQFPILLRMLPLLDAQEHALPQLVSPL
jgi:hypothetical protein